ncbi:MAG: DNA polymerase III subunit epsilon [Bacteroidetes bacterium HGW-Bacteroidetes-6]|jgi:DNA polymerase-3 subunit epsilon|nr:MAG: DNA polymerase III subunit epsilon [Bacteroidetes bacterium HGW-Bacteroidetes-6]
MKIKLTKPLAVFDIESTGVVVGSDKIVEIFILRIDPDGTETEYYALLNPGIPIPPFTTAIHGISDADVVGKPLFKDVAHEMMLFLNNCDLAGYNSNKFDIPLLVEEFLRCGIEFDYSKRRFVDVMGIFHKMEPRNLAAAYKFYCGKKIEHAHSADADTRATWEILQAQLERYENTEIEDADGNAIIPVVNDIEALSKFSKTTKNADLVGHIQFNDKGEEIFAFGKYKGQKVEDVFRREPQYYDWMMKSSFPESTKRYISAIKLRGFNNGNVKLD